MSLSLYFCGLNRMPDMGYNTWSRRASHSLSAHFMLLPEAKQSHLTGSGQLAFFETSLAFFAAWQNSNCHSLSGYVTETDKVNYGIHLKQYGRQMGKDRLLSQLNANNQLFTKWRDGWENPWVSWTCEVVRLITLKRCRSKNDVAKYVLTHLKTEQRWKNTQALIRCFMLIKHVTAVCDRSRGSMEDISIKVRVLTISYCRFSEKQHQSFNYSGTQ